MRKNERLILFTMFLFLVGFTIVILFVMTYRDPSFDAALATRQIEAGLTAIAPPP